MEKNTSIEVSTEKLIEKMVEGWCSEDQLGFCIYADADGWLSFYGPGWPVYSEAPEEDELIREEYLTGHLNEDELREIARDAIYTQFGGLDDEWELDADSTHLVLELDAYGDVIKRW